MPHTTPTRLRQLAFITPSLSHARTTLTHILDTPVLYSDPSVSEFGLENIIIPLGGDMIEVVAPIRPNTSGGRYLEKRGEGGYMVIMQTGDAQAEKERIVRSRGAGREVVVFEREGEGCVCVQFHPNLTRGGILTELDSTPSTPSNPSPLTDPFSPWPPAGPDAAVKRPFHLSLLGTVLRLAPGDIAHEDAAREWEETYGVVRSRDLLAFTNARLGFVRGEEGKKEGIVSVTVGVRGQERLNGMLERARERGLCGDGWINMAGVRWYFVLIGTEEAKL